MGHETTRREYFEPAFVRALFDEMSQTYGVVNTVSSFGFAQLWRRQCVAECDLGEGMTVVDLMAGCGECWPFAVARIGASGRIIAVDFSAEMCRRAREHAARRPGSSIEVREEDALRTSVETGVADRVIACFALKTLSEGDVARFAEEVARILRPGARFCAVEISAARRWWLGPLYRFYLMRVIPIVGRCFMGNPENYRMLGVYTGLFGDCTRAAAAFRNAGLVADEFELFFGCATGIRGSKPR